MKYYTLMKMIIIEDILRTKYFIQRLIFFIKII
uniref:Uncharacterized protein n=1 Tax=Anguilla anguilla TaxID=7936 RepID=A0A0E9VGY0_ANGAN